MKNLKVLYMKPELHSKTKAFAAANNMTLTALVEKAVTSIMIGHECKCKKG